MPGGGETLGLPGDALPTSGFKRVGVFTAPDSGPCRSWRRIGYPEDSLL